LQKVTAQDWLADALSQYRAAANHAENAALPLFLAAFSLGALVYENVIHTQNDVTFAAAVFFAPALAVKPAARALLFADVFLDDTAIITSRAPPEYRAQKGASLGAYKALFELEDALAQCGGAVAGGGIPTLVFIDPEDEFVSLPALRKQAAGASNWKIVTVSNAGAKVKPPRHHLIIDADCVSALTWNTMCETTLRFLEGLKP
jgi:hypothetical protein